jgi:molecular chaperone HscB
LAEQICTKCQTPQPVREGETYFSALGVEMGFAHDLGLVEKRFYELSRALHPDRFAGASPLLQGASLVRMSFLNQALQTLKSPQALREYILKLHGFRRSELSSKGKLPVELAESWFELQEMVLEDPSAAKLKWVEFERDLQALELKTRQRIELLEVEFDRRTPEVTRALLEQLDDALKEQNYLKSIEKDVERMKKHVASN